MVDLLILKGISFIGGVKFLKEERYIEEDDYQIESNEYDAIVYYPYTFYDENKYIIDRICHVEFCMMNEDNELDDIRSEWVRL